MYDARVSPAAIVKSPRPRLQRTQARADAFTEALELTYGPIGIEPGGMADSAVAGSIVQRACKQAGDALRVALTAGS